MTRTRLFILPALALAAWLSLAASAAAPVMLVRYPSYHEGRVAFTYLADIWTADENGGNVRRLTVNPARDAYPRFSPDGRWVAFSSSREGNLDVYVVPAEGGVPKQLTFHSADDLVQGWTPDGKAVLFTSTRGGGFMPKLYTVGISGGMPEDAGPDMGTYACYSPDGKKLAVNRKAQSYWRKYYRGAYQSDVTVMDLASKTFKDVAVSPGVDSWPMWSRDGRIYFVSDREESGQWNVWRVPEGGGRAEKVTQFTSGDVRFPSISSDGKVIVFEHDFGIWKLDLASRKAVPLRFELAGETQSDPVEVRSFESRADDFDVAPGGRRIAFSVHGEIFTVPVDQGDMRQITDGPARDRGPGYSPDGKTIAYVSDVSGREEIYVKAADGSGEPQAITNLDALKMGFEWSPDGKEIVYAASDYKLRKYRLETRDTVVLAGSAYSPFGSFKWSPDGRWIAFTKDDRARTTDVYLVPSGGGEERKVTFEAFDKFSPEFSPDGKKLYYQRMDRSMFGGRPDVQVFAVTLEREARDPSEPDDAPDAGAPAGGAPRRPGPGGPDGPGAAPGAPKPVQIDWAGLKRRTRQITRMPFPISGFAVSPEGRTLAFVTSEPAGAASAPVLYTMGTDGRGLTRLTQPTAAPSTGQAPVRGRFGGFGAGLGGLQFGRDGRTLFFEQGGRINTLSLQTGARRTLAFTAPVRIDHHAEWAQMFDDAWRTMKYRFYDPGMHGRDWDAMRARYRPLADYVGERQELLNIVNEMIGELNASHTGAAPPPARGASTGNLGLELEEADGRYRVTHVYEEGPADKDWVKVRVGDYLLALDGRPVKAGDNLWERLNHPLNRKVQLTLNDKPAPEGAWTTRIEPVPQTAYAALKYDRWVNERRKTVDRLSGGRVGYVHIKAMDQPSLRKFERELRENRPREALIIDERWNGGGNIEQELLGLLVQRRYQVWQPRGTEADARPFAGFFGPKAVLQNWRSASNAEMFPAGFRALGLGKVIGTATMGAVIGTGSYTLIDGSTVRTPGVGVYLADKKHTNLENYGVQPDITVENTPEDNLAGRDRQLEAAVQELLKELPKSPPVTASRTK